MKRFFLLFLALFFFSTESAASEIGAKLSEVKSLLDTASYQALERRVNRIEDKKNKLEEIRKAKRDYTFGQSFLKMYNAFSDSSQNKLPQEQKNQN